MNNNQHNLFTSESTTVSAKPTVPKATFKDVIAALVVFGGIFLFSFFSLLSVDYGAYLIGYVKAIALFAIFSLSFFYVKSKNKHFNPTTLFFTFCGVAVILPYFFSNSNHFFALPLLVYLIGALCISKTDILKTKRESYRYLVEEARDIFVIPLKHLFLPLKSIFKSVRIRTNKKINGIVLGVILAMPVILILFSLLVSGDTAFDAFTSAFSEKISEIFDKLIDLLDNNFEFWFSSFWAGTITLVFAPAFFSAAFCFRHGIQKNVKSDYLHKEPPFIKSVPANIAAGFYLSVCLLYTVYLFTQLSYLFGAFSGKIPFAIDMSLSEYARQGFFEMSIIAFINLSLITVGVLFVKRRTDGRISKLFKAIFTFLCFFTTLLVITAVSKMALYITEMGLTHLRILVCVIDFIILATLVCIFIKLYKDNFPYMKIIVSLSCAVLSLYCLFGDSAMIASYNTNSYLEGCHTELDVLTIHNDTDKYHAIMNLHKVAAAAPDSDTAFEAKYWIGSLILYSSNYSLEGKLQMSSAKNLLTTSSVTDFLFWEYVKDNETFSKECLNIFRMYDYDYYEDTFEFIQISGTFTEG